MISLFQRTVTSSQVQGAARWGVASYEQLWRVSDEYASANQRRLSIEGFETDAELRKHCTGRHKKEHYLPAEINV